MQLHQYYICTYKEYRYSVSRTCIHTIYATVILTTSYVIMCGWTKQNISNIWALFIDPNLDYFWAWKQESSRRYSFLHINHCFYLIFSIDQKWLHTCTKGIINITTRHVFANGSDCPVLVSYQMWFGQKLFKNAKITTKIMKIWLFCEIQSGNAQNRPFPVFWRFWTIFGQKLLKNAKKAQSISPSPMLEYGLNL